MAQIQNSNFESLFSYFFLPEDYTIEDIQNDKEAIVRGLREIAQHKLGSFRSYSRVSSIPEKIRTITIGTGTTQTLVHLPSVNLFYKAEFAYFGAGYMIIGIHEKDGKFLIKNIIFGLPESNSKTMKIVEDFTRFMMKISIEQKKDKSGRVI